LAAAQLAQGVPGGLAEGNEIPSSHGRKKEGDCTSHPICSWPLHKPKLKKHQHQLSQATSGLGWSCGSQIRHVGTTKRAGDQQFFNESIDGD